jgi:hypothetical protein
MNEEVATAITNNVREEKKGVEGGENEIIQEAIKHMLISKHIPEYRKTVSNSQKIFRTKKTKSYKMR